MSDAAREQGEQRGVGVWFRVYLGCELTALYWVLPLFIDFGETIDAPWWLGGPDTPLGRLLIPALWLAATPLFFGLLFNKRFRNRSLWNWGAFVRELPRICLTASMCFAVMMGLAIWLTTQDWAPEEVGPFALLQRDWRILLAICLLYPILSVYPQEIVLRTWFFHRYKKLMPDWRLLLTVNALTFAWVHIIFENLIAVLLCIPAGFLFGWTYLKTKSTLASGLEHALVGNLMWIAGIGWFFFAGSVNPNTPAGATDDEAEKTAIVETADDTEDPSPADADG